MMLGDIRYLYAVTEEGGASKPWPPPPNFLNFFFFRRRWWYWPNSGGSVGCSGGGFSRDGGVGFVGTAGFGTTWWPS
jgi:hypothetical protein